MKTFDKQIVSSTAIALHLSDNQVLDIMCSIWEDAIWQSYNVYDIICDITANFGLPILSLPENREVVEKMVRYVRDAYEKYYSMPTNK